MKGLVSGAPIKVNRQGVIQSAAQLKTTDGTIIFDIANGTKLLTSDNSTLSYLTAGILDSPPAPISGDSIIAAYTFGPDGAKFDPALTLTISYDPFKLPENITEEGLYIAYYDGTQMQSSNSTVDTEGRIVRAKISHLSSYVLMGKAPLPSPTPVTVTNPVLTQPTPTAIPLSTEVAISQSPSPSMTIQPVPSEAPPSASGAVLSIQTNNPTSPVVSAAQTNPKESNNLLWLLSLFGLVVVATIIVVIFIDSRDKSRKL